MALNPQRARVPFESRVFQFQFHSAASEAIRG